jgi:general secretion pathway protein C
MKRLPLIASFLLFIALCASIAYWAMQLFKPSLRPVAAPPQAVQAEVRPDAAANLFGGSMQKAAVASNYQLKGIIFSGSPRNSVAILSADGKAAQAVRVDMEVAPGVVVKEVHREYVLLADNGTTKRVELPEGAKGQVELANLAPVPVQPSVVPSTAPPAQASPPIPTRAQAATGATPAVGTAASTAPSPSQPPVPGMPPATATTSSPIPSGVVPPVQLPPTAPPTVVVSPPPGSQQGAPATTPSTAGATAARNAPASTVSAAPATSAPPATAPSFPPRPPSSDSAPLISR